MTAERGESVITLATPADMLQWSRGSVTAERSSRLRSATWRLRGFNGAAVR